MRLPRKGIWVFAALVLASGTGVAAATPALASTGAVTATIAAKTSASARTSTGVTATAVRSTTGAVSSTTGAVRSTAGAVRSTAGAVRNVASAAGKRADLLEGVSCAAGTCYAAGYTESGAVTRTLIEAWHGKTWVREPSPSAGAAVLGAAISCAPGTKADRCLDAGTPALAGSGGSWKIISKGDSQLDSVSCPAAGACVLVGQSTKHPVYATWNGKAFKNGVLHAPPHSFQTVAVSGVSCASPGSCVAVGDYTYGVQAMPSPSARDKVLAEQWNGHTWRLLSTVNVSNWNQLTAVSCASAANCTAVGTRQDQYPFAERWNGKTWKVESVPTVSTIGYLLLTSVACPASGFCVAAGTYQGDPVAETWNGSSWHVTLLPQPSGDNHSAQLNGVSCLTKSSCVAVGVSGNGKSYAETYTSGKWRLSSTVNPV